MPFVKQLLIMIVFAIVLLVVYNVLKHYVLNKIKVSKWIVLALAIVVLFAPSILTALGVNLSANLTWQLIPSGLFIILFLWFMDLSGFINRKKPETSKGSKSSSGTYVGYGKKKDKKKDVVIKPKAKPNRVKNKKD